MALQLRIYVPPHPLLKHWLAVVRDANTPMPLFRAALAELGRWLTYEASRDWLPTVPIRVQTPLTTTEAEIIDASVPIAIIPILRAGLALLDSCTALLPTGRVYHVGYKRNEATLEADCYLNSLPECFDPATRIMITEPMIATGGTLKQLLAALRDRGADLNHVRIISILVAAPALQGLGAEFPEVTLYTAMIDEALNEAGFIVPGLGDAGDRAFGTL